MNDTLRAAIVIAIAAAVTIFTRFISFAVFKGKRETPKIITYLGKVLPYAIMGMLVVFCLKGVSFTLPSERVSVMTFLSGWFPELAASAVTVALYVSSRQTLIAIVGGTICYMELVQLVFI